LALDYGQLPENIALSTNGSVDVNFNGANELANISSTGTITPLGALPTVPGGGTGTPLLKMPFSAGMVNNNGALYTVFSTGLASLNGVYLTLPGGSPTRIAPLPAGSLANGIAENFTTGTLYITDSALGKIWTVSAGGGTPTTWASGKLLEGVKGFGANGLKLHDGALYVSNTSLGTLIRIPVLKNGKAGVAKVVAKGLPSLDDFAFIPGTNNLIAALNFANEVAYVQANGTHSIILTSANGLENPSAVAISNSTVYITNADYYTLKGPSVMEAPLT
jgi:sugar lactone lactonase YvrE